MLLIIYIYFSKYKLFLIYLHNLSYILDYYLEIILMYFDYIAIIKYIYMYFVKGNSLLWDVD